MSRPRVLALVLTATLLLASCSSDDGGSSATSTTRAGGAGTTSTATATTEPVDRPDGPAATVSSEMPEDGAPFLGAAREGDDLKSAGYVEQEFAVTGTATSYEADGELSENGEWELKETGEEGEYTTRILVRRPAEKADSNGTVLLEWLNVSGGLDANPDYSYTEEEILRGGYTWIGMSAQSIGVEGGPVAVPVLKDNAMVDSIVGAGLKKIDPTRYGDLSHPGDQFSYDMFTQVARALRSDDGQILGGIPVDRLIAMGESQSAFALTTYANGVQPLTEAFDGFLIHSRGGPGLPLTGGDKPDIDISSAITGAPAKIRTDLRAPTLMIQSEADVLGVLNFYPARQPDSDTVRTWEMAGTAHVDQYLLGSISSGFDCGAEINDGPMHFVLKAGLRALDTWVRAGTAPPEAEPFETEDAEGETRYVRDEDGIVEGGVRTPVVDVPTRVLSGEPGPSADVVCLLAGSTIPMTPARLKALYGTASDYEAEYEKSADEAIEAGFVLKEDREALLEEAQPDLIGKG